MKRIFQTIALIGKPRNPDALQTHKSLYDWLNTKGYNVLVDHRLANDLDVPQAALCDLLTIGDKASLAIVVGGDGNMLGAARVLSRFDVAVIGVNRGNLGFLTDLDPMPLIQNSNGCWKAILSPKNVSSLKPKYIATARSRAVTRH